MADPVATTDRLSEQIAKRPHEYARADFDQTVREVIVGIVETRMTFAGAYRGDAVSAQFGYDAIGAR